MRRFKPARTRGLCPLLAVVVLAACGGESAEPGVASSTGDDASAEAAVVAELPSLGLDQLSSVRLADLQGTPQDLAAVAADHVASVFLFARTDCPISNRYAPEVTALHQRFGEAGVAFRLVFVDPSQDTVEIARHLGEFAYTVPALLDPEHRLVGLTGAEITPEAAVFDADGRLVYRGRIDDRYVDFGKSRQQASKKDLEEVLTAMVAGRPPAPIATPAVGCFIRDLK